MKIYSKFRDYYDGMARFGIDDELIFRRNTSYEKGYLSYSQFDSNDYVYYGHTEGNCFFRIAGIFVPALYSGLREEIIDGRSVLVPSKVFFDVESFRAFLDATRVITRPWHYRGLDNVFKAKEYSSIPRAGDIELVYNIRREQDKYAYDRLINPCLKDFGVASVLDPYTVHQELMQWLANKSNPEPEMVPIDDRVRIQQHGFDTKISFRKRKF